MKDLLITVYGGGDEAVAAVQRVSEDWRTQLEQAADEIERLRLTDDERKALAWAEAHAQSLSASQTAYRHSDTLRGLLDRMNL